MPKMTGGNEATTPQSSGKRAGDDNDGDAAPQRGARAGAATPTPTSDTGGMISRTRSASKEAAGNKDKDDDTDIQRGAGTTAETSATEPSFPAKVDGAATPGAITMVLPLKVERLRIKTMMMVVVPAEEVQRGAEHQQRSHRQQRSHSPKIPRKRHPPNEVIVERL